MFDFRKEARKNNIHSKRVAKQQGFFVEGRYNSARDRCHC